MNTPEDKKGSLGVRIAWAAVSPVLLALAAFSGFGIFLIPALSLYLDGRSRTFAAAATVLIGSVALGLLWGPVAAAAATFIAVTTAAAYGMARAKVNFTTGLVGSAAGGVLGATAMLGILGASLGQPVNEAAAGWMGGMLAESAGVGLPYLDLFVQQIKAMEQGRPADLFNYLLSSAQLPSDGAAVAEKLGIVGPYLETLFAQTIPGMALVTGMLTGGLAYYLPVLALKSRCAPVNQADGKDGAVPPFSAFRIPKYIVISILLLQITASIGAAQSGFATIYFATMQLFNTLMTIQALALLSYLLNRKKVKGFLQFILLAGSLVLFWWLLYWVGFFDALFDIRAVIGRVEALKAKGKQVFTQAGLNELRKMDREGKNGKNDKGKDGKGGEGDDQ